MRKTIALAAALLMGVSAYAQDPLTKYLENRFGGPDSQTFIPKGSRAVGISGGYRSINAMGDDNINAGYALFSLLNVGDGHLNIWNVSPSYSTFLANDLSLGIALNYSGYTVDTDIRLDFRDFLSSTSEALNVTISNRSTQHHSIGMAMVMRKYMPFFGSKWLAVFGEGRLYASYGGNYSSPRTSNAVNRERESGAIGVGLKAGGGIAFKLKDNSAITLSVPLFGIAYNYTVQNRTTTKEVEVGIDDEGFPVMGQEIVKSRTHMSNFNASRNVDLLGIQFGFVRYIEPKRR